MTGVSRSLTGPCWWRCRTLSGDVLNGRCQQSLDPRDRCIPKNPYLTSTYRINHFLEKFEDACEFDAELLARGYYGQS